MGRREHHQADELASLAECRLTEVTTGTCARERHPEAQALDLARQVHSPLVCPLDLSHGPRGPTDVTHDLRVEVELCLEVEVLGCQRNHEQPVGYQDGLWHGSTIAWCAGRQRAGFATTRGRESASPIYG